MKYCTICEQMLPLSHYRTKKKRPVCTKCWTRLSREPRFHRFATLPYERDAERMHEVASSFSRTFMKTKKGITVQDCRVLCRKYKLARDVHTILPLDLDKPFNTKNFVIVSPAMRRKIKKMLRQGDRRHEYTKIVSQMAEEHDYKVRNWRQKETNAGLRTFHGTPDHFFVSGHGEAAVLRSVANHPRACMSALIIVFVLFM